MSLGSTIKKIISGKLFKSVETYVLTFGAEAVKIAATTPLGIAIKGAIDAAEAKGGTGPEKLAAAVVTLIPYIEAHGIAGTAADIETVVKTMIEDVLAQIKVTGPLAIFKALVALL